MTPTEKLQQLLNEPTLDEYHLLRLLPHLEKPDVKHVLETLISRNLLGQPDKKLDFSDLILASIALQFPDLFTPHLAWMRENLAPSGSFTDPWPWRGADEAEIATLFEIATHPQTTAEVRETSWQRLLQTRKPDVIAHLAPLLTQPEPPPPDSPLQELIALGKEAQILFNLPPNTDPQANANFWLHDIAWHASSKHGLQRLCHDTVWHLQFPADYIKLSDDAYPAWALPDTDPLPPTIGGDIDATCHACQQPLSRLISVEVMPQALPEAGKPLSLAVCTACLGWELPNLYYTHDHAGQPHCLEQGPHRKPRFERAQLSQTTIRLARTPARYCNQLWDHRENLNRLGGEPVWVQSPEYPACPRCQNLMPHLAQFDSNFSQEHGEDYNWGSGGLAYVHWCTDCRISGWLWQCT